MTPKQPAATGKDVVRVAEKLSFVFRRQRGSHAIYVRQSDQARVVIPMHKGELKRKTLTRHHPRLESKCRGVCEAAVAG